MKVARPLDSLQAKNYFLKKMLFSKNTNIFNALILLITNVILKIPLTSLGFFAFAHDQGRDFLAVSKIIYEKNLTLIGPHTGLPGIFYGPWWYYFLAPILLLSDGDPQKVAIFFAIIGVTTNILLYFLLKHLTKNNLLSLLLALVATFSASSGFGPINIWSPTLTPILMIIFIYLSKKIMTFQKPLDYFLLGVVAFLVLDSTAAFGVILIVILFTTPIIFRSSFLKKQFLLTILGGLLVFSPRIIFDFKNNFLISKAVISYLLQPKVYGESLSVVERLADRTLQFVKVFSQGFVRNNDHIAIFMMLILSLFLIFSVKKSILIDIKKDVIFKYLLFLLGLFLVLFSIFPDIVWDYYLTGLPIIFVSSLAIYLSYILKNKPLTIPVYLLLVSIVLINFNKSSIGPVKITWLGDGATYRNPKMIMDYLASQDVRNYSFYAFSPAIFDYPFEYLVWWYAKRGQIESPKENQTLIYLVIREASTNQYKTSGWYGDKTKDKTKLLERKEFPGDLVLEIHGKNE